MPRRAYRNAPITEVVCEFRFQPGKEWDLALPGLMYEALRQRFPEREQGRKVAGQVEAGPDVIQHKIVQTDTVRFISKDKQSAVQLSPHQLSVSRSRPYSRWEDFLPMIQDGLRTYRKIAKPKGLQRVGLRYINQIDIKCKKNKIEMEDYFNFYPFLGKDLPQSHALFVVGIEIPFDDSQDILRLQMTTTPSEKEDIIRIILDLDYFCGRSGAIEFKSTSRWLKKAHSRIENVFEGCISDSLREQFGEIR